MTMTKGVYDHGLTTIRGFCPRATFWYSSKKKWCESACFPLHFLKHLHSYLHFLTLLKHTSICIYIRTQKSSNVHLQPQLCARLLCARPLLPARQGPALPPGGALLQGDQQLTGGHVPRHGPVAGEWPTNRPPPRHLQTAPLRYGKSWFNHDLINLFVID